MSRIPQTFIDDLLARVDIAEVIGGRVQLKQAGREFKACCPFHDEKTPSFTVSPTKQFYHCFGCGAHGTALTFLMEHEHLGFRDAVEELAGMAGLEVPQEEGGAPRRSSDDLYALMEKVADFYRARLRDTKRAIDYLKARGLDGETAAAFGIGYAPDRWDALAEHLGSDAETVRRLSACGLVIERDQGGWYDRFRDRVMFPIRDARGRTIAFGGRVLGDGEPKYLNSPETALFHKGRELYGLFECRQALRQIDRLMVVEGYMDVVGLHQAGIRWAVATLGTATTEDHLRRLFRLADTVVFCFDGDRAGRQAAWKALETSLPAMREGHQVSFLFLPEGEDPDSLVRVEGEAAFTARVEGALPLSDYLLQHLAGQVDMGSLDGRARMAELARPLVARIPRGVYRDLLVRRLAETVGMESGRLGALIEEGERATAGFRPATRGPAEPPSPGRSLARRAIAMVLHHPSAAAETELPEGLAEVEGKGLPLLRELLEVARSRPDIGTAGLLERWRDRPEHPHLSALAAAESLLDTEGAARELGDTLRRIVAGAADSRFEFLQRKQRESGLSMEEKEEYRRLLARSAAGGDAAREAG